MQRLGWPLPHPACRISVWGTASRQLGSTGPAFHDSEVRLARVKHLSKHLGRLDDVCDDKGQRAAL
jgi:hypothetical protein